MLVSSAKTEMKIHLVRTRYVNSYVIEESQGLMVIDVAICFAEPAWENLPCWPITRTQDEGPQLIRPVGIPPLADMNTGRELSILNRRFMPKQAIYISVPWGKP